MSDGTIPASEGERTATRGLRPPGTIGRRRGSRAGRWALRGRRELLTRLEIGRHPHRFDPVATCCLFIGHVKSGGSLLGAMIDAHPNAVLADEVDVVAQAETGLTRAQIFTLLVRGARREARLGRVTARRLEPYSLAVPGQWQGRHQRIEVVGDSRAGPSTRLLGDDLSRLTGLRALMGGTRLAFVHVVRNPFEPIGAMVRRSGRSVPNAVADHREQCRRLVDLHRVVPAADLLTIRYEQLVAEPRPRLREVLAFLGLDATDEYVEACAGLLHPEGVRERDRIEWTASQIADVESTIASFDFLAGYGYDR